LVTSIFLTIQGEGPYQGRPALFIRLTHCNLNCSFCDTYFEQGDWFSIHELLTMSLRMIRSKYRTLDMCGIVITGGEPALQPNIADFLLRCEVAGVAFTQIESNGTLFIPRLPEPTMLVISPKCSEKTGQYFKPNDDVLKRAFCFKFVVSADPTSPYHTIPAWAFEEWVTYDIYISPMNMYKSAALEAARKRIQERKDRNIDFRSTVDEVVSAWDDTILDREKNRINHNYAAKYALDNGFYLTLQMHLFAQIA
jgi:organic radical activating enzyme